MKKHTKIYLNAFNYSGYEFIPSEISGNRAVDVHHIESRKSGSSTTKDRIENLMMLTREEHIKFGDKSKYMVYLLQTHRSFLRMHSIPFDESYINEKIMLYTCL